ncbi:hypothetical protein ABN028_19535 [Actinopolymorpha sp. B17G11]|uniref:hypothetical protein n=1 Tax=Actinopolymorpha sp. B17G11 TaxID=3160861 RepID=UPI0032E3FBD6
MAAAVTPDVQKALDALRRAGYSVVEHAPQNGEIRFSFDNNGEYPVGSIVGHIRVRAQHGKYVGGRAQIGIRRKRDLKLRRLADVERLAKRDPYA